MSTNPATDTVAKPSLIHDGRPVSGPSSTVRYRGSSYVDCCPPPTVCGVLPLHLFYHCNSCVFFYDPNSVWTMKKSFYLRQCAVRCSQSIVSHAVACTTVLDPPPFPPVQRSIVGTPLCPCSLEKYGVGCVVRWVVGVACALQHQLVRWLFANHAFQSGTTLTCVSRPAYPSILQGGFQQQSQLQSKETTVPPIQPQKWMQQQQARMVVLIQQ